MSRLWEANRKIKNLKISYVILFFFKCYPISNHESTMLVLTMQSVKIYPK